MKLDITKVVEEIAMQVQETQEAFIFETIQPYCENILQMKINKEELKQILLNSMQRQKSDVLDKIRAEIIELPTISFNANDVYKADILQIIDKYIEGSEDEK